MNGHEYPGYIPVSQLGLAGAELPLDASLAPPTGQRPPSVMWDVPEYLETPDLFLNARLLGATANCLGTDVVLVTSHEDVPAPFDCLTSHANLIVGRAPHPNQPDRFSLVQVEFGRTSILQAAGTTLDNAVFENNPLTLTGAFARVLSDGLRNGLAELASLPPSGAKSRQMAHLLGQAPLVLARVDLELARSGL